MIEISLFGQARISRGDQQLILSNFQGIKPRHVLLLLAIHLGYPSSKERLADALWQSRPPASWISTLEGYVSLLRRGLAVGADPTASSAVLTCDHGYMLDASRVTVDLHSFDDLLIQAEAASRADSLAKLTRALKLADGEVLAGERNAPWVIEVRERYQQRVCRAAVKAGRLALQAGDIATASRHGHLARELDPLAEDGWQLVIESQWRDARRSDALRSFNTLRSLLDRELGIAPCRSLQQLFAQVLQDEPHALTA
jgi:DNA-binding SARP family transcriptional activator